MIRKHHDRIDGKRVLRACGTKSRAQCIDMFDQQPKAPVGQGRREEIPPACNKLATIIGH